MRTRISSKLIASASPNGDVRRYRKNHQVIADDKSSASINQAGPLRIAQTVDSWIQEFRQKKCLEKHCN